MAAVDFYSVVRKTPVTRNVMVYMCIAITLNVTAYMTTNHQMTAALRY